MSDNLLNKIIEKKKRGKKLFAVLIDPEKCYGERLLMFLSLVNKAKPDFIFVGGSKVEKPIDEVVLTIKSHSKIPLVLFLGDAAQFSPSADALLFLSLISGRNPDFLIGQHVKYSQKIRQSSIETVPVGYILIDGEKISAVEKVSKTAPLSDIDEIISTAIAGELLGNQLIYLEAGSGAKNPVNQNIISKVRENISIPLIVGGGICSEKTIENTLKAGADIVVVGNYLEKHPEKVLDFAKIITNY